MSVSEATQGLAASFAANLRAARKQAGLTQLQLAERLGRQDFMPISRWERGEHVPSLTNQIALAQALGRDVSWFYTDHSRVAA